MPKVKPLDNIDRELLIMALTSQVIGYRSAIKQTRGFAAQAALKMNYDLKILRCQEMIERFSRELGK